MNLEPKDGDFQSMVEKMAKLSSANDAGALSEQIKAQEESSKDSALVKTKDQAPDQTQLQAKNSLKTKIKPQIKSSQATDDPQETPQEDKRPRWSRRLINILTTTLALLVFFVVLMLWAFFKECLKHYWLMLELDAWEAVFIFLGFMGLLLLIGLVDYLWKRFKRRKNYHDQE